MRTGVIPASNGPRPSPEILSPHMQRFTHRVRLGCTASLLSTSFVGTAAAQSPLALRYDRPARVFEESLPLGNGRIGAAVFGGARVERLVLNDITLWSGRPVKLAAVPDVRDQLPVVREALRAQQWARADSLVKRIQGPYTQSYAPLGDLSVTMTHGDAVQGYTRVLDLATATSTVRYEVNGVTYTRRTWVSHPDQVLVMELTASKPRALDFRLGVSSLLTHAVTTRGDTLTLRGEAPVHAEPSYRGAMPNAIVYDSGKGTRFALRAHVVRTDGVVNANGGTLDVDDASHATVLVSIATSFDGFDREPALPGRDEVALTRATRCTRGTCVTSLRSSTASHWTSDRTPHPSSPPTHACSATRVARRTHTSRLSTSSTAAIC
jgi:alpha-L-fucosidase 2